MLNVQIDQEILAPLVERVVADVLAKVETKRDQFGDKIAYSEQEAARLLSLQEHQLRDERYRGRIKAAQIVKGRIRYTREALINYLAEREWKPK